MAFQQPFSRRFFTAFYNWNHLTPEHHTCPRTLRYRRSDIQYRTSAGGIRTLIASPRYRHSEAPLAQEQNISKEENESIYTDILQDNPVTPSSVDALELSVEEGEASRGEPSAVENLGLQSDPTEAGGQSSGSLSKTSSNGNGIGESVRTLMRNVAHPVAIITAAHREPDIDGPAPLGMVVSSFNTVTMNPPTISFNVRQPSRTLDAIRADNGRLRVHIMAAVREGGIAADLFAGPNSVEAFRQRLKTAPFLLSDLGSDATQRLDRSEVSALDCELTAELDVEDHKIIVAKVTRATTSTYPSPSLQYMQGMYRGGVGPAVADHQEISVEDERRSRATPFVIREHDRWKLVERVESYVKQHPELRDMSLNTAEIEVVGHFPIIRSLGISARQIIARTLDHLGLPEDEKDEPVLYDFYEQLSYTDMKTIALRLQRLVRQDPDFLSLDSRILLQLVHCHGNAEIIPSHLLNSLRKEGLLGEFEPFPDDHVIPPQDTPTLQLLEQIEHRLRVHIRTNVPATDPPLDPTQLAEVIGVPWYSSRFIRGLQWKLRVEENPSFHVHKSIDIAGELDENEARVVVCRVVSHMRGNSALYVKGKPTIRPELILRDCNVHPFISGALTAKFLFLKLANLGKRKERFSSFLFSVRKELELLFDPKATPTYSALRYKINALVDKNPLRAVRWSERDIAAWANILPGSRILYDEQDGCPSMPLRPGTVYQVVRQALRAKFPEGGLQPDPLIAGFMKGRKNNEAVSGKITPRRVYRSSLEATPLSEREQHYARLKSMIPVEMIGRAAPAQGKSLDQRRASSKIVRFYPAGQRV